METFAEIIEFFAGIIPRGGRVWIMYSTGSRQKALHIAKLLSEAWVPVAVAAPGAEIDGERRNVLRFMVVNIGESDAVLFVSSESNVGPVLEIVPDFFRSRIVLIAETRIDGFRSCSARLLDEFGNNSILKKYHDELNYSPVWHYRMIRNEVPYRRMMQALLGALPPIHSAVDIGCGIGLCIRPLKDMGIKVRGIDYSAAVVKKIAEDLSDLIEYGDLTAPLSFEKKYDLVICVEVAEHLRQESAATLIDNIDKTGAKFLLFSAAPPGQGGTGHVNEREREYWEQLLNERNFSRDDKITKNVVNEISRYKDLVPWLINNVVVYTKRLV